MPFYKIVTWVTDPLEKKPGVAVQFTIGGGDPIPRVTDDEGIAEEEAAEEAWIAEVTDPRWPGIDPEERDGPTTVDFHLPRLP